MREKYFAVWAKPKSGGRWFKLTKLEPRKLAEEAKEYYQQVYGNEYQVECFSFNPLEEGIE